MFVLRCPHCGNTMKYAPAKGTRSTDIGDKNLKKRCVYCGRTFSVKEHIVAGP